jgi:hypothetical protein
MRFLTVLFAVLLWLVLFVAIVAGISYGLGRYFHSRQGVAADPGDTDACAQCNADRDWYHSLPVWQKTAILVWWLANRYQCAVAGCK